MDVLPHYIAAVALVEPTELPRILRDPQDDHVLACALAAQADLIVSGDADLRSRPARDIPIFSATEAVRRFETQR
jgi:predicted nucleic acid-binding protein